MKSTIAIAAAAAAFFGAGTASAEPPANIGGTTWTLQANRDAVQLVITNQGGPGGPAGDACPLIIGTIGIAPIQGLVLPVDRAHPFPAQKPEQRRHGPGLHRQPLGRRARRDLVHGRNDDGGQRRLRSFRRVQLLRDSVEPKTRTRTHQEISEFRCPPSHRQHC